MKRKSHYSDSYRRDSFGYSLLEISLTLPILLLFMVGAVDVNRTYQAYNAVREGVKTANRCTWSTDGGCSDIPASPAPGPSYFNWTGYNSGAPTYYGNKYRYYGTEYHLLKPTYRLGNFGAFNLASQEFSWDSNQRNLSQLTFPAEGIVPRIYQTRAPHLAITRIPGGRPIVAATYLNNSAANYQNNISYSVNGNPSLQWSGTRSGTVTFTLSGPTGDSTCRKSTNFNSTGPHAPGTKDCGTMGSYEEAKGDVIISVYGNDGASLLGSNGTVTMSITGPGLSGNISLGGRNYSTNDDASLCPRVPTLPSTYVTQTNCAESTPGLYDGFTKLKYNKTYTLHFQLQNGSGDIHWNFESLQLYLPRVSSAWDNWEDCQGGLLPSQMAQGVGCVTSQQQSPPIVQAKNPSQQPGNSVAEINSFHPTTLSSTPITGISQANCAEIASSLGPCADWFEMPSTPISGQSTENCSGTNYGTSIISVGTNNAAHVHAQAALNECGTPVGQTGQNIQMSSITYTAGAVTFPGIQDVLWEPQDCNDNAEPVPSQVLQYPMNSHTTTFESYGAPTYLGVDVDPRVTVSTSQFSCNRWGAAYSTGSAIYDQNTTQDPFFDQVHFEYEVGCSVEDWSPTVRTHAESSGLSTQAYFEADRTTQNDYGTSTEQTILGEVSEQVFNQYANTACEMTMLPGQSTEVVGKAYGSCETPYTSAPAYLCQQPGVFCTQEFAGFCGGNNAGGTPAPQTALQSAAQAQFYARVKTLYPAAELGCDGYNCAKFDAPAGYDPNDPQGLAQWQGTMDVPLLSANLIEMLTGQPANLFGAGKISFSLGNAQARTFEAAHVK